MKRVATYAHCLAVLYRRREELQREQGRVSLAMMLLRWDRLKYGQPLVVQSNPGDHAIEGE